VSRAVTIHDVHEAAGEDRVPSATLGFYDPAYDDREGFDTGALMVMPLKTRIGIKVGVACVRRPRGAARYSPGDEDQFAMVCNAAGNTIRLSQIGERDPTHHREAREEWVEIWKETNDSVAHAAPSEIRTSFK